MSEHSAHIWKVPAIDGLSIKLSSTFLQRTMNLFNFLSQM